MIDNVPIALQLFVQHCTCFKSTGNEVHHQYLNVITDVTISRQTRARAHIHTFKHKKYDIYRSGCASLSSSRLYSRTVFTQ